MTHEPPKSDTPRAHTIKPKSAHPKGDGQWKKWAAGAAGAVVLLGGGYFLLKNMGPADSQSEIAYNDSSTVDLDDTTTSGDARNTLAAETASDSATPAAAPARRRQAAANAVDDSQPIEQVVGVSPATATTSDDENEIIVQGARAPQWSRTPSARRLSTAYPERALERGREGEASVSCTVQQSGALDCVRVSETPANAGFGMAALRVARMYTHAPERWNGAAAAGTPVNLRVMFRLAEEDRRG